MMSDGRNPDDTEIATTPETIDNLAASPSLAEAFRVWLHIGLMSFGGPAAQIALMHRKVVDENQWLSEKQFLSALSFCMLLPGPEAMQLATYAGWRLHGVRGGLIAGLLFVLPGAAVILVLASVYSFFGDVPLVNALFLGVKAAVIIIVVEALLRISKKALKSSVHWGIAAIAFVCLFFFNLPYPLIILAAALLGFFALKVEQATPDSQPGSALTESKWGMFKQTVTTVLVCLALWIAPFILLWLTNAHELLWQSGVFFSKLAVVTFGGAYAVLAYLGQDVVTSFGWLTTGEMMDGLGLAETTPGPLILVTEFVGFLAGFKAGGFWLAIAAALMTLWVTFIPCFLWIFAGAPYIDWLGKQPRLANAMSAITAAVVGVILNLSLWFALHVLFTEVRSVQWGPFSTWSPTFTTMDWRVWILTIGCAIAAFGLHWPIVRVLCVAALAGLALSWL